MMRIKISKTISLINTVVIFLILFGMTKTAICQEIVYACKISGAVTYKNADKWQKLTEGAKLSGSSWIKIGKGGAATLIKTNGFKTLYGKKISHVKDIVFVKKQDDWSRLYLGLYNIFNGKPRQGNTVITRGGAMAPETAGAMLFPADGEQLLTDTFNFQWRKQVLAEYHFSLSESPNIGELICKNDWVRDTQLSLPDSFICTDFRGFDTGITYLWSMSMPADEQIHFIKFSFAGLNTIDSLHADLKLLELSGNDTDKEIKLLLKAGCYETYRMFSEAEKIYRNAKSDLPESLLITEAYNNFRKRIEGLNQFSD